MTHDTLFQRIFRVRYLAILLCLFSVTACLEKAVNDAAKNASKAFIMQYYVEDNLKAALKYTQGSANKTLSGEQADIEASGMVEPPSGKPTVLTNLEDSKMLSDTKAEFFWKVTAEGANTLYVKTTLDMTEPGSDGPGSNWLVSNFTESQKAF